MTGKDEVVIVQTPGLEREDAVFPRNFARAVTGLSTISVVPPEPPLNYGMSVEGGGPKESVSPGRVGIGETTTANADPDGDWYRALARLQQSLQEPDR